MIAVDHRRPVRRRRRRSSSSRSTTGSRRSARTTPSASTGSGFVLVLLTDDPDASRDPGVVARRRRRPLERQLVLRLDARARGPGDRRVRRDRRLPLLRALRGDADPDLLPDRRLRRAAALVRRGEVPAVQPVRRSAHAGLGRRALRRVVRLGRRAVVPARGPDAGSTSAPTTGRWLFLGFFIAFAVKAPMWPVHTWLPEAASEATPGHVRAPGQRARQDRHVRDDALLPRASSRRRRSGPPRSSWPWP